MPGNRGVFAVLRHGASPEAVRRSAVEQTNLFRRVTELEAELEEAQEQGDGEARAAAREELDALVTELTAAYGLAGRPRRSPDHVERARKAVRRRLSGAMGRIARAHPRLGRHLAASIRTGEFCSYQPEREISWSVFG
jgi:hypothetical protein